MTTLQAYDILAISQDAGFKEVKKQYRQLMHRVHPDTDAFDTECYAYTAQEINEAYAILCKKETADHGARSRNTGSAKAAKVPAAAKDMPRASVSRLLDKVRFFMCISPYIPNSVYPKKAGADPGKMPVKQPPQICVVLFIVLFILLSVQP